MGDIHFLRDKKPFLCQFIEDYKSSSSISGHQLLFPADANTASGNDNVATVMPTQLPADSKSANTAARDANSASEDANVS